MLVKVIRGKGARSLSSSSDPLLCLLLLERHVVSMLMQFCMAQAVPGEGLKLTCSWPHSHTGCWEKRGGLVNIHASPTALTRAPRQCCQDSLPEEVKGVFILILLASSEILLVIKLWTFVDFQNRGRNELGKFHMLAVAGLLMGVMERHSI